MKAYSIDTNTEYDSWDDLVAAEANGYVAVALVSSSKETWPWVMGPFPDRREANNARNRMRTRFKREMQWRPGVSAKFFVRPVWKEHRGP